jgi:ABC-type nitrate/sulfonate/bicarbonate transport system substrate-binding protein
MLARCEEMLMLGMLAGHRALLLSILALTLACGGSAAPSQPAAPASSAASKPAASGPAAASQSGAPDATGAATQPGAAPPLTHLPVGYAANSAIYVPLWIAVETKAFEKYGLDVELAFLPGNASAQSLVSGQVPIVAMSGFASAPAIVEGADIAVIAATVQRHTAGIYAVPGVDSPQSMRGKKLGITRPGTLTYFGALVALREWGLRPDEDVILQNFGESSQILTGLLAGVVDAGVLSDPNSFVAAKQGYPELLDLSTVGSEYTNAAYNTTHAFARQNRALVLNFLRGYLEGHKRYFEDGALAKDLMRKYVQIEDQEILDMTYPLYRDRFFQRVPMPTVRGMQNIFDDYAGAQPKAREVDPARAVDTSFMEELRRDGFLRSLGLE